MADTAPKPGVAKTPPPASGNGSSGPSARPRGRPKGSGTNAKNIEQIVTTFFEALAVPFQLTGDTYCAQVITNGAPALGKSWAELAKVNPTVARMLNSLTTGSVYGGLIYSHLVVLAPVCAHHGIWPAGIPNPVKMAAQAQEAANQNGDRTG